MKKICMMLFAVAVFPLLAVELQPVKYVFLFIGDGTTYSQLEAANRYLLETGQKGLTIMDYPSVACRTEPANDKITDSAAAGTAIATGSKTNKKMLGMAPDGTDLESIADVAKANGKKVGILTTVTINNATPAAFFGCQENRHNYYLLGQEMVKKAFDYYVGNNLADAVPASGCTPDKINELAAAVAEAEAQISGFELRNKDLNARRDEARKNGENELLEKLNKEKQGLGMEWKTVSDGLNMNRKKLSMAQNYVGSIFDYASKNGFINLKTRKALAEISPDTSNPVLFYGDMPWWLDRCDEDDTPLDFLVAKGIELLDNPNGFFMMVEGGRIDWACHGHDAGSMLAEILDFERAVQVAAEFEKKHPGEVLVVITGDHETGGLELCDTAGKIKNLAAQKHSSAWFSSNLKRIKASADGEDKLEAARKLVTDVYGLQFEGEGGMVLDDNEKAVLDASLAKALGVNSPVEAGFYQTAEAAVNAGKNPGPTMLATQFLNVRCGLVFHDAEHTSVPTRTAAFGAQAREFLQPGTLTTQQKEPTYTHKTGIDIPEISIDNTDIGLRLKQAVAR